LYCFDLSIDAYGGRGVGGREKGKYRTPRQISKHLLKNAIKPEPQAIFLKAKGFWKKNLSYPLPWILTRVHLWT
jgi:hypothetical protein